MRKIFTIAALALFLGCGATFPQTSNIRGTGGDRGRDDWVLRVDNNNWSNAKVYLIPAYGGKGHRVITVNGMTRSEVTMKPRVSTFRFQIEFLASRVIWVSQLWGPGEPCLEIDIRTYIPSTNVFPCWSR